MCRDSSSRPRILAIRLSIATGCSFHRTSSANPSTRFAPETVVSAHGRLVILGNFLWIEELGEFSGQGTLGTKRVGA
jgi:hypothetical protein